jgi:hypothetical protein
MQRDSNVRRLMDRAQVAGRRLRDLVPSEPDSSPPNRDPGETELALKRLAIAIGAIAVIVALGLAVFAATFNVNRYRADIEASLAQRLGRSVTLGYMRLRLILPEWR